MATPVSKISVIGVKSNPMQFQELPLHALKTTVWCGLWAGGTISPYFFKNEARANVIVKRARYRPMITDLQRVFVMPRSENLMDAFPYSEPLINKKQKIYLKPTLFFLFSLQSTNQIKLILIYKTKSH